MDWYAGTSISKACIWGARCPAHAIQLNLFVSEGCLSGKQVLHLLYKFFELPGTNSYSWECEGLYMKVLFRKLETET
jgi:hypothetical protein